MKIKMNILTAVPDVMAHIYGSGRKNQRGVYTLRAYGVDKNGSRIKATGSHQRSYRREDDLQMICHQLVAVVEDAAKKQTVPERLRRDDTIGIYSAAVQSLDSLEELRSPQWADSTFQATMTYFKRNILPVMDTYGTEIVDSDMAQLADTLALRAAQTKRGSQSAQKARQSVESYLYRINSMLKVLYDTVTGLPHVFFPIEMGRRTQDEQPKCLPDSVRVKLAASLIRLTDNGLALGVAMMFLLGLRTAEACAARIGDLIMRDGYVVYPVLAQLQDGERTDVLKTAAAYRITVGGKLLYDLIVQRMDYLCSQGISEKDLLIMPVASVPADPRRFAAASKLSDYAKRLILACGYSPQQMLGMSGWMRREPDIVDGEREKDPTAYLLRRDWTSRALNVCGMRAEDVDYLLGHVRHNKTGIVDYTARETQAQLADQLERHVLLPEHSTNPAFDGINLGRRRYELSDFGCYRLTAVHGPVTITLDIEAAEAGVPISIITNGVLQEDPTQRKRPHRDRPNQRAQRPIIGDVHSIDYYNRLIREADMISLD